MFKSGEKETMTKQRSSNAEQIQQQIVDEIKKPAVTFKLVVVGESFTGKTSLIRRFFSSHFQNQYNVTVGADFLSRAVQVQDGNDKVNLQIWDTCGHDMYRSMTSSFYRGACGVLLTFSVGNRKSFERVKMWYDQFRQEGSSRAFVFLVGTKVDEERVVSVEEAMQLMKKIRGAFYIQTSAQTGEQVEQLFQRIGQTFYKTYSVSSSFRALANPRKFHHSSVVLSSIHSQQTVSKRKRCCS